MQDTRSVYIFTLDYKSSAWIDIFKKIIEIKLLFI